MRRDLCVEAEKNACDLRNLLTATPLWAAAAAAAHMLPTQRRRLRLQQRRPNDKLVPHSTASTKRNNNNNRSNDRAPHCCCTVVHKPCNLCCQYTFASIKCIFVALPPSSHCALLAHVSYAKRTTVNRQRRARAQKSTSARMEPSRITSTSFAAAVDAAAAALPLSTAHCRLRCAQLCFAFHKRRTTKVL